MEEPNSVYCTLQTNYLQDNGPNSPDETVKHTHKQDRTRQVKTRNYPVWDENKLNYMQITCHLN